MYAFRFLSLSLCLELSSHQDIVAALNQLKNISILAQSTGDKIVQAVATTVEAAINIQYSSSPENVEQAQRSLAAARSLQLDPAIKSLPKLTTMTHLVDICSTLQPFDPSQAMSKMPTTQALLQVIPQPKSLSEDGSFAIPVRTSEHSSVNSSSGVVRRSADGRVVLVFDWISDHDINVLGFLLGGVTLLHENTTNGLKAEHMLREGLRWQESKCFVGRVY